MKAVNRKPRRYIQITFLIFVVLLGLATIVACDSDDSGDYADSGYTPSPDQTCREEQIVAENNCFENECTGCAGFSCVYCWDWCSQTTEYVYYSCCERLGIDCTPTTDQYSISGGVTTQDGQGLADVEMHLSDYVTRFTDIDGYYEIYPVTEGGTLTPEKAGFCFEPESQSYPAVYYPYTQNDFINQNFTARQNCSSISGSIKSLDGTPLSSIIVELTGDASASTVTNTYGHYIFSDLYNGAYVITPVKFGSTPLSRAVTVNMSDALQQDFVITGRAISGTVALANGTGVPDISLILSDALATSVATDSNGYYVLSGIESSGLYSITPSTSCKAYSFDKDFITVDLLNSDVTEQDFLASAAIAVTGNITAYGVPLADIDISITGNGSSSTTTYSNGLYGFYGIQGSVYYTITPAAPDYIFMPENREIKACDLELSGQDFSAVKTWFREFRFIDRLSIDVTSDGGFIAASGRNPDIFLSKHHENGNIVWQKHFDAGTGQAHIHETADGGYIVAAYNAWVMKLDSAGNVLWQKDYGDGWAMAIQESSDGYIMAGYTVTSPYNFQVQKIDLNGNVLWQKTYGGDASDFAESIAVTPDGGCIVAGRTESFASVSTDFWVVRLDSDGNMLWQKTYGGEFYDTPAAIRVLSDDGFILVGRTSSFGVNYDTWVLKLDNSGNVVWQKAYGGSKWDFPNDIEETSDGGYIIAGDTTSFSESWDAFLLKLDPNGNILWQKTYGGSAWEDWEFADDVEEASDGGYIISGHFGAGSNTSRALLFKTNPDGNLDYCEKLGSPDLSVTETNVFPVDSSATVTENLATVYDTNVVPKEGYETLTQICPAR